MGKRHVNRQRNSIEDAILMSTLDEDADFEAAMHAMDRRFAQRKRKGKTGANRFGDYEETEWLSSQDDSWDDYDGFLDDPDLAD